MMFVVVAVAVAVVLLGVITLLIVLDGPDDIGVQPPGSEALSFADLLALSLECEHAAEVAELHAGCDGLAAGPGAVPCACACHHTMAAADRYSSRHHNDTVDLVAQSHLLPRTVLVNPRFAEFVARCEPVRALR